MRKKDISYWHHVGLKIRQVWAGLGIWGQLKTLDVWGQDNWRWMVNKDSIH